MKFTSIASLLVLSASPALGDTASDAVDVAVLKFALILENLENAFYTAGTAQFKAADYAGLPLNAASIVSNFVAIAQHESTHVQVLTAVITKAGGTPDPACVAYNLGLTTGPAFIATARVLERVGTSAYNGAIGFIKNPQYLTYGASIAEIEARHASFLNTINRMSPFPNAFETPLTPKQVTTLAVGFFSKCTNVVLPYAPNPALTLNAATANVGDTVTFTANSNATYCAFLNGFTPVYSAAAAGACAVPAGVSGDVFVFLTNDNTTPLPNDTSVVAGPTSININTSLNAVYAANASGAYMTVASLFAGVLAIVALL